jgi:tetratricopeptide (TPR) repeat protein
MRARALRTAGCVVALLVAAPLCAQTGDPVRGDVLAPAQADLEPVPLPPLDGLEAAVAAQMSAARAAFTQAAGEARTSKSRLGAAYGELARLFHAYEFFGSAEPAYRNAARLQRSEATWPHLLGYLYQQTGRFEDAARQYAAAFRVKADDRAAALRLADVWLELNRLVDAREQYGSLLTVFPAAARRGLGEVSLRERRYREAVEHFSLALERAPQASALHYSLAMAYRGLGRLDDARAHLERRGPGVILAVDPYADALPGLIRGERLLVVQGSRAHAAGRFREAADAFERALAAAPQSVPARINLAAALLQLGEAARAIEYLRDAYADAPGDVEDTLIAVVLQLSERERYGEAIALLDGAERRSPGRRAAATTLARLLASSPDVARRDGARALELAMQVYRAEARASHAETVALALAELGRCGEALEWMRRAIAAAEAENDAAQLERLRAETPRYQASSCRAPGR